jgi:hypothetical protein
VNAKGKSLEQEFAEACRQAVQPELDAAKKAHFQKHGDAEGKVPCEVLPEGVQFVTVFADEDLRQRFRNFHNSIADLRIVATKVNLSLGGSERLTKPKRPVVLPARQ